MRKILILHFVFITLCSVAAFAQTYHTRYYQAAPNQSTIEYWRANFFGSDEIWVIKNKREFFKFLKTKKMDRKVIKAINAKFYQELPELLGPIISLYGRADNYEGGYVLVNASLKSKITPHELSNIYVKLKDEGHELPSIGKASRDELIQELASWNLSEQMQERFQRRIAEVKGLFYFFVTPLDWPYLPVQVKDSLIEEYAQIKDEEFKYAKKISITVVNEQEIKAVAQKYAGRRNPQVIERYLKRRLLARRSGEYTFALEEIMPVFIRKNLNVYDLYGGPNCFNSVICVQMNNQYQFDFTTDHELRMAILKAFQFLSDENQLQTGDLLIYRDENNDIVHTATYIDEKTVFTKNGISKFMPYIFQNTEDMQKAYFPGGNFKVQFYRPREVHAKMKANCRRIWENILEMVF